MLTRRTAPLFAFPELGQEMERVMRLFETPWNGGAELKPVSGDWRPALDVSETKNEIVIKAELPGVDPEKIEVNVEGDVLTISGSKEDVKEHEEENVFHTERRYGAFMRRLQLGSAVDRDSVKASFKNGVLNVRLTKMNVSQSKRIPVSTS